jgi:(p)ppGpp synthase/HD superfamily hydrolase
MGMAESHTDTPMLGPQFQAAVLLAIEVHRTQLRKTTTVPYIAHIMGVLAIVLEEGGGQEAAVAALLHDAVEDASDGAAMLARIRTDFGDRVADIVLGCSDTVAVPGAVKPAWKARKQAYIDHLNAETDTDILLVSCADKLHNSRSIVRDLRTSGDAVWSKFSGPKDEVIWYYDSLAKVQQRLLPGAAADELARTVALMKELSAPARDLS